MSKRRHNPTKKQRQARKAAHSISKKQTSQASSALEAIRAIEGLTPENRAITLLAATANELAASAFDKISAGRQSAEAKGIPSDNPKAPENAAQPVEIASVCQKSLFDRIKPCSLFDQIDPSTIKGGAARKN